MNQYVAFILILNWHFQCSIYVINIRQITGFNKKDYVEDYFVG